MVINVKLVDHILRCSFWANVQGVENFEVETMLC